MKVFGREGINRYRYRYKINISRIGDSIYNRGIGNYSINSNKTVEDNNKNNDALCKKDN